MLVVDLMWLELVASEQYKGERDRAGYLDDLQAKTKLLSVAAAEAMAGLCVSPTREMLADDSKENSSLRTRRLRLNKLPITWSNH
jgi:hypothetical protein